MLGASREAAVSTTEMQIGVDRSELFQLADVSTGAAASQAESVLLSTVTEPTLSPKRHPPLLQFLHGSACFERRSASLAAA